MCPKQSECLENIQKKYSNADKDESLKIKEYIVSF